MPSVAFIGFRKLGLRFGRSLRHRDVRHLVYGLPALLLVTALLILKFESVRRQPRLQDSYAFAAASSMQAGDWSAAIVCYRRLSELRDQNADARYDLANALWSDDRQAEAVSIMQSLADLPQSRVTALRWLALRALEQFDEPLSRIAWETVYPQLMDAFQAGDTSPEITYNLARYHVMRGNADVAESFLTLAADDRPSLRFDLSLLQYSKGDESAALDTARRAEMWYREQLSMRPREPELRLKLASLHATLGSYPTAERILNEGVSLQPAGPFQQALSDLHVLQFDRIDQSAPEAAKQAFFHLRRALEFAPDSRTAIVRLSSFVSGDQAQSAREMLEAMLPQSDARDAVHFALGCQAAGSGEIERSLFHLRRAFELDSKSGIYANNYAWLLASADSPNLDLALEIADEVVSRWPDSAEFRDTRGSILVRMGHFERSLPDLEFAASRMPDNAETLESLGSAYLQLGRISLAKQHLDRSAVLRQQQSDAPTDGPSRR